MKKTRKLAAHGLRSLNRHRLRTTFMMLGTFVGVAALTITVSIGRNTEEQVVESINRIFGASSIMLRGGGMHMSGGRRAVSGSTLTLEDLAAIATRVKGIEAWDPMVMVGGREVSVVWEGKTANVPVMGHSPGPICWWRTATTRTPRSPGSRRSCGSGTRSPPMRPTTSTSSRRCRRKRAWRRSIACSPCSSRWSRVFPSSSEASSSPT